jgi:hypothetical protein
MKFISLLLLALTTNVFSQELHLPFSGRWFVMAGGDTLNVNHHMSVRAQWYAIDFMKVGGADGRSLNKSDGKMLEDYYSWGEPVLSPVDGVIETVIDEFPDNLLGVRDTKNVGGNYVVIKVATDRYVFLCHFQKGSISVKSGEHVKVGQTIGKCGNSGNTYEPHIHMHMQDAPTFGGGTGQNLIFKSIDVELTGKKFTNVDWPMICGLFVSNH